MGRYTNKILAGVALFMAATVVAAIAFNFIGNTKTKEMSGKGFTYSLVSYDSVGNYSEKLAPVEIYNRWGYCDNQGKVLIVPRFAEAGEFSSGLAAVKEPGTGLYGYIDNSGNYVIEPQFSYAGRFSEELAACSSNSDQKLGYIDKTGKFVISEQYDKAGDFSEGLAKVRTISDGLYSFIDPKGSVVIPEKFTDASDFSEGLAAVSVNGEWGYIDKTGNMVIQPKFTQANAYHEKLAAVKVNNSWGYIDKKGKLIIKNTYSEAGDFSGGFAPVKFIDSGLWGYINNKGETAIHGDYQNAAGFSDGVAAVKADSKWIFVTDNNYNLDASEQNDTTVLANNGEVPEKNNDSGPNNENEAKTISNKNVTNLVQQIQLHVNESKQLSGLINANEVISKLVLNVIGEDGEAKGIYLSIKPDSNTYNLEEVSIDGSIEPFNAAGKYKLQLLAKLEGELDETMIGEVNVEVLEAQEEGNLTADIGMVDSSAYPMVNVLLSVNDSENNPVSSLALDNFKLYEAAEGQTESEQKPLQVTQFNKDEGLNVALVFDSSLSMYNDDRTEPNSNMEFAKESAINFINSGGVGANDLVSIQSFGRTFTMNQDFTGNADKLVKAIGGIKPKPDTAIYDAITRSLDTLSNQKGKKCIIIFTDGEDTVSNQKYIDSIESARIKGIPVYSIAIGQEAKTNELKSISDKTGGVFYYLKDTKELSDIYKGITDQLRFQYQLTYRSDAGTTADKKKRIKIVVTSGKNSIETESTYGYK